MVRRVKNNSLVRRGLMYQQVNYDFLLSKKKQHRGKRGEWRDSGSSPLIILKYRYFYFIISSYYILGKNNDKLDKVFTHKWIHQLAFSKPYISLPSANLTRAKALDLRFALIALSINNTKPSLWQRIKVHRPCIHALWFPVVQWLLVASLIYYKYVVCSTD